MHVALAARMKRSAIFVLTFATVLVMTAACSDESDDKCCPVSKSFVCENFLSAAPGACSLTGSARKASPTPSR